MGLEFTDLGGKSVIFLSIKYYVLLGDMEKEYAIGIDLGGTSVKYALIDNEGVFYFQGKLPSKADVSAEAVIGQLVTMCPCRNDAGGLWCHATLSRPQ